MITKARFLEEMHRGRREWEALLAEVGPARMTVPGVDGDWTMKDIVAHVTYYERWAVERLDEAFGREVPPDEEIEAAPDTDARNAIIYWRNRDRPLEDVLTESHQVFARFADYMREIPEEGFADPAVTGLPPEWVPEPWKLFSGNSYEHYHQHIPGIRDWLASLDGRAQSNKESRR